MKIPRPYINPPPAATAMTCDRQARQRQGRRPCQPPHRPPLAVCLQRTACLTPACRPGCSPALRHAGGLADTKRCAPACRPDESTALRHAARHRRASPRWQAGQIRHNSPCRPHASPGRKQFRPTHGRRRRAWLGRAVGPAASGSALSGVHARRVLQWLDRSCQLILTTPPFKVSMPPPSTVCEAAALLVRLTPASLVSEVPALFVSVVPASLFNVVPALRLIAPPTSMVRLPSIFNVKLPVTFCSKLAWLTWLSSPLTLIVRVPFSTFRLSLPLMTRVLRSFSISLSMSFCACRYSSSLSFLSSKLSSLPATPLLDERLRIPLRV